MCEKATGEILSAEGYTLITGASSGIGKVIALELSHTRGIILSGRRDEALEKTALCCAQHGLHKKLVLDLAKPELLERGFRDWRQDSPEPIKALVYSAGVFQAGPLRLFQPNKVADLMRVNCESAVELCRLLLKRDLNGTALKQIVLISSVAAYRGVRGYAVYAATKGALESFVRALAVELAPGVRINTVCPGAIETERSDPTVLESAKAVHPLGIGRPADVSAAVRFLLSEDARWITGQHFTVDGGWSCS